MIVKEYNNWYKSYNDAYSFVNNIDHAIAKAGCSANYQMQCIGWNEDVKQTLIDALETLKYQKRQMVVMLEYGDQDILQSGMMPAT